MSGSLRRRVAIACLVVALVVVGVVASRQRLGSVSGLGRDPILLPAAGEVAASPPATPATAASTPSDSPNPQALRLGVPYTTQAPLGDWDAHQESCEEATLLMLAAFWSGGRQEVVDPRLADRQIRELVSWQIENWGAEDDLTAVRLGELAKGFYGYRYQVLTITEETIRRHLAAGRPVIVGVTTHGLGNPNYPHYQDHRLQVPYDVPHFLVIVGYDAQGFVVNDPGIGLGRGYHVLYPQLVFAIDDLDQKYPAHDEGRVMLVIEPAG